MKLERQIEELTSSLNNALADAEAKGLATGELAEAKAAADAQLKEATEALTKYSTEQEESQATLLALQQEVIS